MTTEQQLQRLLEILRESNRLYPKPEQIKDRRQFINEELSRESNVHDQATRV